MVFESFDAGQSTLLWSTFAIALVMGAVVNKTNFCTMGAVSDLVNMGDWSRMRAWLLAITVALIGVALLESQGMVRPSESFPPYRGGSLAWIEHLLGGLIFGVGMTLASGCGNKTLIRIGAGNLKSIVVIAVIAVIAFYMTNPFPGSSDTLYSMFFYNWTNPLAIDMGSAQDLGSVLAGDEGAASARLWMSLVLAVALLAFIFKSSEFRSGFDNILGGVVVGLAVLAGWYVSSSVQLNIDDELYSLSRYYAEWDFIAESAEGKPAAGAPLNPQSFTFINPMGQSFGYIGQRLDSAYLTFGIMALFGVMLGSFIWALLSRSLRVEWFVGVKDFITHLIGAVLMGLGGVLAMGCTIGQGITGVSTLAIGSFITFFAIIYGSAITMKVQLYKMVYDDSSFFSALLTALVDLHLLPKGLRKHESV